MTDKEEAERAKARKVDESRQWREENAAALAAYDAEVARDGLPLANYRSF